MNLSQKIEKLLVTEEEGNVNLAKGIVVANINQENVIAFICVLKNTSNYQMLKDNEIIRAVESVLEKKVTVPDNLKTVNFDMSALYRWALQSFKSIENIEESTKSYINYVNRLSDIEMLNLTNQNSGE